MDTSETLSAPLAADGNPRPRSWLRRRAVREWMAWALLWLLLLGYSALAMRDARQAVIAHDLQRLQSQAQAVAANLIRQLHGISDALAGVRMLVAAGDLTQAAQVPPQLKLLGEAMPGVGALQVLDAEGRVTAASRADVLGQDFSTRSYFVAARQDPDGQGIVVAPPFRSTLNRTTTVFARAMRGADGQFHGAVTASLNPDYFELVLRAALYADDARASLVHGDGQIIVSSPLRNARVGFNLNVDGSMFQRHVQSGQTTSVQQGVPVGTDEHRLVAMRSIAPNELRMDHPLVVRLSRSTDAVLAPWRTEARNEALLLLAALGASGVWLRWHQSRRRLQERTERAAAQAERASARRLEFGLRGADLGLWEWNLEDDSVSANAREMEMLGYPPSTEPLAKAFWQGLLHPDDRPEFERASAAHLRGETPSWRLEHRYRHRDGHWVWVLAHAMVMERNARGQPLRVVGTHLDISERKHSQLELERMNAQLALLSLTDGLTGVANRRQFDQALETEWVRGLRQRQPMALLMIDIDHFKLYNDHLGHPEGDACLRVVAQILSGCLRQPLEKLARYGGEEFAALLTNADDAIGTRVAQRCIDAIAAADLSHPASPLGPRITVSIGVASLLPRPAMVAEQLVQAADAALYRAKQYGRARYAVATESDAEPRSSSLQSLLQ